MKTNKNVYQRFQDDMEDVQIAFKDEDKRQEVMKSFNKKLKKYITEISAYETDRYIPLPFVLQIAKDTVAAVWIIGAPEPIEDTDGTLLRRTVDITLPVVDSRFGSMITDTNVVFNELDDARAFAEAMTNGRQAYLNRLATRNANEDDVPIADI